MPHVSSSFGSVNRGCLVVDHKQNKSKMSGDEAQDVELRELVAQTLENNGVLPKIRAELRASVFLALEDQEGATKSHFENKPLMDFVTTREGTLVLSLVRELLEYFELDNTLSVFDPETKHGKDYNYTDRNQLLKDLKINNLNGRKGPLLAQVLQLVQAPLSIDESLPTKHNENHIESSMSFSNEVKDTLRKEKEDQEKSMNTHFTESVKIANRINEGTVKNSNVKNGVSLKSIENDLFPLKLESIKPQSTGGLSLLGNLPPLSGSVPGNAPVKQQKEDDLRKLQKEMLELGIDPTDNDYEEDFHSSVSVSPRQEDQSKDSNTEIEEELMSGLDDGESINSGPDNVTVDDTVSNTSNVAGITNHMEDVTRPSIN